MHRLLIWREWLLYHSLVNEAGEQGDAINRVAKAGFHLLAEPNSSLMQTSAKLLQRVSL